MGRRLPSYLPPLVAVLAAGVTLLLAALPEARAQACSTAMIPAYFYAGPLWEQVISSNRGPTTMILNPSSGPGSKADPAYQDAVRRAQAAGIDVIGYVHTSWGSRRSNLVKAEVDRYFAWYGVDGIFFDEAATGSSALSYYRGLYRHVKGTPGARVVLNHGTIPDRRYMDVSDVAVTFEGSAAAHAGAAAPSWSVDYPPSRFAHLVYASPSESLQATVDRAAAQRVGNVYVTDDDLPNPWDTLPGYFSDKQGLLGADCPTI